MILLSVRLSLTSHAFSRCCSYRVGGRAILHGAPPAPSSHVSCNAQCPCIQIAPAWWLYLEQQLRQFKLDLLLRASAGEIVVTRGEPVRQSHGEGPLLMPSQPCRLTVAMPAHLQASETLYAVTKDLVDFFTSHGDSKVACCTLASFAFRTPPHPLESAHFNALSADSASEGGGSAVVRILRRYPHLKACHFSFT